MNVLNKQMKILVLNLVAVIYKYKKENLLFIKKTGNDNAKVRMIWLHGWRLDHKSLLQLSELLQDETENYLIDLPGFGQSETPSKIWGTIDYANELIIWLKTLPPKKTYIIGHSFGGRVAIQISQLIPEKISGIILIAASGLKMKRSIFFKIKATTLKYMGKCLKNIDNILNTSFKENFARNFGSSDYRAATGIMRKMFVKIIHEDLTNIASLVKTPALLIYGAKDEEAPPIFGSKYNKLMTNSQYFELPVFDHNNILTIGRHQVYNLITNFLGNKDLC